MSLLHILVHASDTNRSWIDWIAQIFERANASAISKANVVALPPVMSAEEFSLLAIDDSVLILLLDTADRAVARRSAGAAASFIDALAIEISVAVCGLELTQRLPSVVIDLSEIVGNTDADLLVVNRVAEKRGAPAAQLFGPESTRRNSDLPVSTSAWGFPEPIAEVQARLLGAGLQPLLEALGRGKPDTISWPSEIFLSGDAPGTRLPAVIEVGGSARIVSYGPYLPLPSGIWRVELLLGFSIDFLDMPFLVEFAAPEVLYRGYFRVSHGGFFELPFELEFDRPGMPAEIRVVTLESALEGRMSLIEATFKWQRPVGGGA